MLSAAFKFNGVMDVTHKSISSPVDFSYLGLPKTIFADGGELSIIIACVLVLSLFPEKSEL